MSDAQKVNAEIMLLHRENSVLDVLGAIANDSRQSSEDRISAADKVLSHILALRHMETYRIGQPQGE